jgi:hypothetical protein
VKGILTITILTIMHSVTSGREKSALGSNRPKRRHRRHQFARHFLNYYGLDTYACGF